MRRGLGLAAFVVLVLAVSSWAGARPYSDVEEYRRYVWGDAWPHRATAEVRDVRFEARYLSPDAVALPALARGAAEASEVRRQASRATTLHLRIEPVGQSDDLVFERLRRSGKRAYDAWLNRLLFGMADYVELDVDGGQPIPLGAYHMERTFGVGGDPGRSFFLTFPEHAAEALVTGTADLVVREFGLRTGSVRLSFPKADARSLEPSLWDGQTANDPSHPLRSHDR